MRWLFIVLAVVALALLPATALADHGGSHVPPNKVDRPGQSCDWAAQKSGGVSATAIALADMSGGNVMCQIRDNPI